MLDQAKHLLTRTADYFACRLLPHGPPILPPVILATLALCASLADDGCDYARLTGAAVEMLTGSNAVPFVDCGMAAYRVPGFYPAENAWRVAYVDECRPYDYRNLLEDTSWVAAEWLKFLGLVAGGTTAMFLWTATCLTLRLTYWHAAGGGCVVACLCHMCSFVWFYTKLCHTSTTTFLDFEAGREVEGGSDAGPTSECRLFFGSKCAITSCVLWGAAAAVILLREYPVPVPKLIAHEESASIIQAPGQSALSALSGRRRSTARMQRNKVGHNKSGTSTSLTASMSTMGQSYNHGSHRTLPLVSDTPGAGLGDSNRTALHTSMRAAGGDARPATSVRPAELSGSTFSAVSFA